MRTTSDVKGLHDLRTAVSTHHRSVAWTRATPYQEIMSLGMEKLRLESELDHLEKRRHRISSRLGEVRGLIENRMAQVRDDDTPREGPGGGRSGRPNARILTVEY